MSFIGTALSFFSVGPVRSFAGITGYITTNETTTDSLEITQQPVQQGAMIADHAFKKPVTLSLQIQFDAGASLLNGFGLFGGTTLNDVYQNLQNLMAPIPPSVITPFSVTTPKRTYNNMLLTTLGCTTDRRTENVLSITANFEEVILVPVGTANVPRSRLKNPASNGGTQNIGKQSALYTLLGPPT